MNNKEDDINKKNEIEVIIGDNSELSFSEVENFVEGLKPKTNKTKKSKIIIPIEKKNNTKKEKK